MPPERPIHKPASPIQQILTAPVPSEFNLERGRDSVLGSRLYSYGTRGPSTLLAQNSSRGPGQLAPLPRTPSPSGSRLRTGNGNLGSAQSTSVVRHSTGSLKPKLVAETVTTPKRNAANPMVQAMVSPRSKMAKTPSQASGRNTPSPLPRTNTSKKKDLNVSIATELPSTSNMSSDEHTERKTQRSAKGGTSSPQPSEESPKKDQFSFIYDVLSKAKSDTEFIYLNNVAYHAHKTVTWNPYNLEIVAFQKVNPNDYYTISAAGVTHFVNGVADYTPLDQWKREQYLFGLIMEIPFFRLYRTWKSFVIWKKTIRDKKITHCKSVLEKSLFILNSTFRPSLLRVRELCWKACSLKMQPIKINVTMTLNEFLKTQDVQRVKTLAELATFQEGVLEAVRDACETALEIFDRESDHADMMQIDPAETRNGMASTTTFATTAHSPRLPPIKGNAPNVPEQATAEKPPATAMTGAAKRSYVQMAQLRKEYKKICNYMKLADYVVLDTLHALVSDTTNETLLIFEAKRKDMDRKEEPPPTTAPEPSSLLPTRKDVPIGASGKKDPKEEAKNEPVPLFLVEVLFEDDDLMSAPSAQHYTESIEAVIADCVTTVSSVGKLVTHEDLRPFIEPMINGQTQRMLEESEGFDIKYLIEKDDEYQRIVTSVRDVLNDNYGALTQYVQIFQPYKEIFLENSKTDIHYGMRQSTLKDFREAMLKYQAQAKDFEAIITSKNLGMFKVDSKRLKEVLMPSPVKCLKEIHILLPHLARERNTSLLDEINGAQLRLTGTPDNVAAFVEFSDFLKQTIDRQDEFQARFKHVSDMYELMTEYGVQVEDDDKARFHMLEQSLLQLKHLVSVIEAGQEEKIQTFSQDIEKSIITLRTEVSELERVIQDPILANPEASIDDVLPLLEEYSKKFDAANEEAKKYERYQTILAVAVVKVEEVETVEKDLKLKRNLWKGRKDWDVLTQDWMDMRFDNVNADDISNQVARFAKTVMQCERGLPDNPVVPILKKKVNDFKNTVPVVFALRNSALKQRHWDKIQGIIGSEIVRDDNFTLGTLINLKVMDFKEQIETVSTEATNEAVLEEMLNKIKNIWSSQEFSPIPYKDYKEVYVLAGVDEVTAALDESMVILQTIQGSRYVAPLRSIVDEWERKLRLLSDTLDEWLTCQRNWMYLESIFGAADIQKQLPTEAKMFISVDKNFKTIMKRTNDDRNALKVCTVKGLLESFQNHNAKLDKIQKSLEDYLETKRKAFPRFYFLSNDELLEILAQSRNPQAVQPHLRKCFDNIYKLEFADEKSQDILAMISGEGEKVALGKNLKARGSIEEWLSEVERSMVGQLKKRMKAAVLDYPKRLREEWIREHPAQCVATVAQIVWCQGVVDALRADDPVPAMQAFFELNKQQLSKLAELVRGTLTSIERLVVVALMTTDVHNRDIVQQMIEDKTSSVYDFNWLKQLRYYWEADIDDCVVRQSNTSIQYGYEYMGATTRLVITPLTDRCWMTLTGALHVYLGGAPAGPAGTGKTETTKDLAKALGRQCVVFNCSDQLDYKMMAKLFSGLAQSGSWTCLDEFNRINIEVLSVIAQQLLTIRRALMTKAARFIFEGAEIPLRPTCGVFITMNPGYAGRTELPDNLKALFRPVSMMIPDYALIAEIMLYAEGFEDAKTLAQKMVKMYKLCSEQLSQQDHYDFGMRQVKSVLVMAGSLKRGNPTLSEDIVLIRALRDSNVPRFLAEDLPLFQAIISDLFPNVVIPEQDYGELKVATEECVVQLGLQLVPSFILKVIQLYETFNVRFGVMLVGPSGGGKTTCYRVLKSAMTMLFERGSANPNMRKAFTYVFNPKCITMGELYGEFNPITTEWTDGLASSIIRDCVASGTDDLKWVVFDGPVDALWIENMNTVLDDNMTLCLANGERIKLNKTLRMLFEVQDLAVASPATVSRCGMVYLTPTDLGWLPYVDSWLPQLTDLPQEHKEPLRNMFNDTVPKGLLYVRKEAKEYIPSTDLNLVVSLCSLFTSIIRPDSGVDFKARTPEEAKVLLGQVFMMSFIWSIGANIDSESMFGFDSLVRDVFAALNLPGADTMYDYALDIPTLSFKPWRENVPAFQYVKDMSYFSILVPTVDTARYAWVIEHLMKVEKATLLNGVTGVGKSVIVQDMLVKRSEGYAWAPVFVNFSAQTNSLRTQETIEFKLDKRRKNLLAGPPGKKVILFVDDVNMPSLEVYGAQPPIELLRQFLDFKGFYDRQKLFWKEIRDVTILAACAPPGGGRNALTPRFVRHFNLLCLPPATQDTQRLIFSSILKGFFEQFIPDVRGLCQPIVDATIEVYDRIAKDLLPIPAKSHYTFNLRDMSKVFQGILMAKPTAVSHPDTMTKLWIHECMRVFYDRLIDDTDRRYFTELLAELLKRTFKIGWTHEDVFEKGTVMFGDYLRMGVTRDERVYEEVKDIKKVAHLLEDYLDEYNLSNKEMKLVFFKDAIEHISRLCRILRQPRGNAMLVGVGGSGKQSLTRLACFIAEYKCFQIELTKGYGYNEFRDDLKKLYQVAGVAGEPITFLFTDTQIVKESFLEDINNVLNTGEVPNLFAQDEMDKIVNDVRPFCKALGIPDTRDNVKQLFISRVQDNLHIVLCMSPVGESFRVRCRMFPSLINCCTIDWFSEWPKEALLSVSSKFFLNIDVGDKEPLRNALAEMCAEIHYDVIAASELFYQRLRRRFYVTPKSYLELINLYTSMLEEKREELGAARDRLKNGLDKLSSTNAMVVEMQAELTKMQPVLATKAVEASKLMEQVTFEKAKADEKKMIVGAEEAQVKEKAEEVMALTEDARKDLDEAMPAMNSAMEALNALNKNDLNEIKSFPRAPELVQKVMEAVCILLKQKPDWQTSKAVLSDTGFMAKLVNYDKDNIPEQITKKLRKYLDDPSFHPAAVEKVSVAAKSLCMWVRAIDVYSKVAKVVEPKKQRLKEMEDLLDEAQSTLKSKQEQLRKEIETVENLQRTCTETLGEKTRLEELQGMTKNRLARAEKLTVGLADESVRWASTVEELTKKIHDLVGNVFLAAGCIAYYGAFTAPYRKSLVDGWVTKCKTRGIPINQDFTLNSILADPVQVRDWQIGGLPSDELSTENAILVTRGRRWPLMIDPQGQANKWVKNMEGKNGLKLIKLTDNNFLRTLESSIRLGTPVLLEDVGEELDPSLEPILQKQLYKQGGRTLIRVGDSDVEYDAKFKLYMSTKMSNPHYLPEVCIKVTIINFTVTLKGLEDQLLGNVVRSERPDLEMQKNQLVVSMAGDKKQLKDLEDKMLRNLSQSEGNILDNTVLIETLSSSKLIASAIQVRVRESEETEKNINAARENYRAAATRGSILYFVVADLALIDPMYQFSLTYFVKLFDYCLATSTKSDDLAARLEIIMSYVTENVYTNACRGLFEEHKAIFSFMLCTAILRNAGTITDPEWNFFLRGANVVNRAEMPHNPAHTWISQATWDFCFAIQQEIPAFHELCLEISEELEAWKDYVDHSEPHLQPLPGKWKDSLSPFQRMMILKAFRSEKLIYGMIEFVRTQLGRTFTENPPMSLHTVFADTSKTTPIIFILSQGADPINVLLRFAKEKEYTDKLHAISLGQGQGPIAAALIGEAVKNGDWVLLQNCHLAVSWMQALEKTVEGIITDSTTVHNDFRLWLTSMPFRDFPVPVLQNGVKLTFEPPRGLRANLMGTYAALTDQDIDGCSKAHPWKKLLFGVAFFHAVLQERRKFGPLGWNIRYEFNNSDFEIAMSTLRMFLEEQDEIPWKALEFVTGEINYGGRVTDDLDRRCLMSILRQYYTLSILSDEYRFSPSGLYFAPPDGNLHSYRKYIEELPYTDTVEVFGLHENASITYQRQESIKVLNTILSVQPRATAAAGGKSPEDLVAELAAEFLKTLPGLLERSEKSDHLFQPTATGELNSLSIVLQQEMDRFNKLLRTMGKTLVDIQKAIKGLVVMTQQLDYMFTSMLNNSVPAIWEKVAYPSLKPLGSWFQDLQERVAFMSSWLNEGQPRSFWLPGFFFPQGFMTGALQNHARKYKIPINTLNFGFKILDIDVASVHEGPTDGVYCYGFFLEGARWDRGVRLLQDMLPGEMYSPLPVIHFLPTVDYVPPPGTYSSPLYKTSARAGVLSTTGQSTNFIISVDVDTDLSPDYWVRKGAAMLCALND